MLAVVAAIRKTKAQNAAVVAQDDSVPGLNMRIARRDCAIAAAETPVHRPVSKQTHHAQNWLMILQAGAADEDSPICLNGQALRGQGTLQEREREFAVIAKRFVQR